MQTVVTLSTHTVDNSYSKELYRNVVCDTDVLMCETNTTVVVTWLTLYYLRRLNYLCQFHYLSAFSHLKKLMIWMLPSLRRQSHRLCMENTRITCALLTILRLLQISQKPLPYTYDCYLLSVIDLVREGFPVGLRKLPAAVCFKGRSPVAVYCYRKMIATTEIMVNLLGKVQIQWRVTDAEIYGWLRTTTLM